MTNRNIQAKYRPNANTLLHSITPAHNFRGLVITVDGTPVMSTNFRNAAADLAKMKALHPDADVRQAHITHTGQHVGCDIKEAPAGGDVLPIRKYKPIAPTAKRVSFNKSTAQSDHLNAEVIAKPANITPRRFKLINVLIENPAIGETIDEILARLNADDELALYRVDELRSVLTGSRELNCRVVVEDGVERWFAK